MAATAKQIAEAMEAMRLAPDQDALQAAEDAFAGLISGLEHTYLGPTWARGDDGRWLLPQYSLGWEIIGWCAEYLQADDSTPDDFKPWRFTDEQMRFLLWWYAVDENGKFLYQTGVLQRLKGWGKDPLLAVICCVEFVGPCRFAGWERNGRRLDWDEMVRPGDQPVAKAHPNSWVQIAAVSLDQTRNTALMFPAIMTPRLLEEYGVVPGIELIRAAGGRKRIETVTSNPKSLEGGRATFVVLNETQWWTEGNNGHAMYEVIDGNVTKSKGGTGRYLAICNAYVPGMDSVGEKMRYDFQQVEEGKAAETNALYDTVEANPLVPLHPLALRIVLPKIAGDAWWLNVEKIIGSVLKTSMRVSDSRRKWLNQIVAAEDQLYTEDQIDAVREDAYILPKSQILLGFDGGKTDDATVLVGLRLADGLAFPIGIWQKPEGWPEGEDAPRWEVDRRAVDSAVNEAHATYDVRGFYADVALWESYIAKWGETYAARYDIKATEGRDPIGWDMRTSEERVGLAHERLVSDIIDGRAKWSGAMDHEMGLTFRRHALNAYRHISNRGKLLFRKESRESKRKVDFYAAWMLAHEAYNDHRLRAKKPEATTAKRVWFSR